MRQSRQNKHWTKQDTDYLRMHFGTMRKTHLASRLGRTTRAIEKRAWKLGIHHRDNIMMVDEVAHYLGILPDRVRKWTTAGKLQAKKVGGYWAYTPDDVTTFLRDNPWKFDPKYMPKDSYWTDFVHRLQHETPWWPSDKAARYIGISIRQMTRLAKKGKIECRKVFGYRSMGYIFHKDALNAYKESR